MGEEGRWKKIQKRRREGKREDTKTGKRKERVDRSLDYLTTISEGVAKAKETPGEKYMIREWKNGEGVERGGEWVGRSMNNEVGVYARKSRRHRRSEFLALAFLFLSRLFRGVRWERRTSFV